MKDDLSSPVRLLASRIPRHTTYLNVELLAHPGAYIHYAPLPDPRSWGLLGRILSPPTLFHSGPPEPICAILYITPTTFRRFKSKLQNFILQYTSGQIGSTTGYVHVPSRWPAEFPTVCLSSFLHVVYLYHFLHMPKRVQEGCHVLLKSYSRETPSVGIPIDTLVLPSLSIRPQLLVCFRRRSYISYRCPQFSSSSIPVTSTIRTMTRSTLKPHTLRT